jgi:hypothetical protein
VLDDLGDRERELIDYSLRGEEMVRSNLQQ